MAQSPSHESSNPLAQGKSSVQQSGQSAAQSDAQQRPGVSGSDGAQAPGAQGSGADSSALDVAKESAANLGEGAPGKSGGATRGEVETS